MMKLHRDRSPTTTISRSLRRSLHMLPRKDRRTYVVAVSAQMATAVLDLAGVLLLGLVAVMAAATAQGNPIPTAISDAAQALGLGSLDEPTLVAVLGATAAILLILKSILTLVMVRRLFQFLADRTAMVSASLSSKFFSCSLLIVQSRPSQEVAYALSQGTSAAVLYVLGSGMVILSEACLLGVLGIALFLVDPFVTIAAGIYFVLVAGLLQRPVSKRASRIGGTIAAADIAATTLVQEGIGSYREVSVLDRRDYYRENYRAQRVISTKATGEMQFIALMPKSTMEIALVVGALLLAGSQFLTREPVDAVATLVIFLAAGSRVMPSLLKIQAALATMHGSAATAQRAYSLADSLQDVEGSSREPEAAAVVKARIANGNPNFDPRIDVSAVSVTYPGATAPALLDATFTLTSGQSLALVGATGAGKSTLADLILGVLEPDLGSITIGGKSPRDAVESWAGGISYVPQDVALSHGSVRQNVALGLPDAAIDDELVWHALERAHLSDFLRDSRDGLDTLIGERGVRLSGGQRQRLGIARGLYTRPRLLVLDEATSALDAETEKAIADTLSSLEGEVTTVTVAHRLATIRKSDLVLYLEGGRILARGSFEEVRQAVPRFNHQAELLGL